MKEVEADGFKFNFADAIDAFVFDEKDITKPTFHGVPMKGVDIVAEFETAYVYVEVKDYTDPSIYDELSAMTEQDKKARQDGFRWLKNYLKYKYRDSFLYRYAEQKVDKPVHYVCLINFDNAMSSRLKKALRAELPVGAASRRWTQSIAASCQVVNMAKWNENYPQWPVTRLPTVPAGGGA